MPAIDYGATQLIAAPAPAQPKPAARPPAKPIALIAGSNPDFTREVDALLRERLRLASILLSAGYAAFLLKDLLFSSRAMTGYDVTRMVLVGAVILVNAFIAQRLCVRCHHILSHLRWAEGAIFGLSSLVFLWLAYEGAIHAAPRGYLPPIIVPWLILMFTYALFIPNTWRSAAAKVATLAASPLLALGGAWWTHDAVRQLIATDAYFRFIFVDMSLAMGFAAVISLWGVHTIRSLRSQAYEARQLGQYRLKRLLGKGGMGEVYLAEHLMLKRPCAIKLIRPEMAGDPDTLARFEHEVQATAKLTHWNTVEIFDFGRAEDGTFYYVMEYLPGMNLDKLVEEFGPLPPARAIHLLTQACDALAEAHGHGLVHRDIKPANIFAARRGATDDVTKLLDFGLVRSLHSNLDVRLTQEGMVTGSPLYMSPEQASGDAMDHRSDIYSLGCVAYYLLTGRPPFEEEKAIKLILAHAQRSPDRPSRIVPGTPGDLESVVMRCLEKNPDDRFPDVLSLRRALMECEAAGAWTREDAATWWSEFGGPMKKELDACVCEGREVVEVDSPTSLHASPAASLQPA